jgi:NADPH:quinone reductase-like Zn-dependent oxidoreductase
VESLDIDSGNAGRMESSHLPPGRREYVIVAVPLSRDAFVRGANRGRLTMRALQFAEFGSVSNLRLVELPEPKPGPGIAIVKVAAGAVSPSDVKNVQGKMEHTTLPRVPGRDYAGTVIEGPGEWIGTEVFGTGGEIGYSIDGSHAELMIVPAASLRRKPKTLSMHEAAAVGVTYLAAWLGLVEYAAVAKGETLLVIGAGGGVGGAAAQIGKWRGAHVIGADRRPLPPSALAAAAIDDLLLLGSEALDAMVLRATKGRGADIVFDTVGGPLFEPGLKALAHRGRQIAIASVGDRRVSFDLLDFYHKEAQLLGVDTRARDVTQSAAVLAALAPFFEDGNFRPPRIDRAIPLADGPMAYEQVARGEARGRLVIVP